LRIEMECCEVKTRLVEEARASWTCLTEMSWWLSRTTASSSGRLCGGVLPMVQKMAGWEGVSVS
jgi:hypothetical protein